MLRTNLQLLTDVILGIVKLLNRSKYKIHHVATVVIDIANFQFVPTDEIQNSQYDVSIIHVKYRFILNSQAIK